MKKFFLTFAAIAAIVFVGCNKEESSDENTTSLVGTVWQGESLWDEVFRLQFISSTYVVTTEIENGESWSENLRYEFLPPYLFIYEEDEYDGVYVTFTGIMNGKAIDIYDGDFFDKGKDSYWLTVYEM